jgi:PIN domain nuclease of toxin-antitoxin system
MRYLLDTHAIIWYLEDAVNLPSAIRETIDNQGNDIFFSMVSFWEITIKVSLGKLKLKLPFDELLNKIKMHDFNVLQIEEKHLRELANLPFLHRDPFDRLLISTAVAENLTIITADEEIYKYDTAWAW